MTARHHDDKRDDGSDRRDRAEGRTVLDAFVDGERVDPDDLKMALADAEGRDYFVDVWLLREAVHDADGGLSPSRSAAASHRSLREGGQPDANDRSPRRAAGKWMVAAALVVGLGGGYLAGNRPASPSIAPPETVQNTPPVRSVFPAPAPTLVIPVEFHADTARNGGD